MDKAKTILHSAILLYFMIALEVLIMISPLAGLFYFVFNPVLLETAKYPATRWLSAFYLPHMVLPQDAFLKFVRITGSVLFGVGILIFMVSAVQVYTAKLTKKKGLCSQACTPLSVIRQYLSGIRTDGGGKCGSTGTDRRPSASRCFPGTASCRA